MVTSLGALLYYAVCIPLVVFVAVRSYRKHSLSYGGACTSIVIGVIHILAGWQYAFLLIVFFVTMWGISVVFIVQFQVHEDVVEYQKAEGGRLSLRRGAEEQSSPVQQFHSDAADDLHSSCSFPCDRRFSARFGVPGAYCVSFQSFHVDLLLLPTVMSYYCECSADTWGSEIGIISSTPYLLLLPWKPVPAGTNGGISLLGMGAAFAAGLCLTVVYYFIQPSYPSVRVSYRQSFLASVWGDVPDRSWIRDHRDLHRLLLRMHDGGELVVLREEANRVSSGACLPVLPRGEKGKESRVGTPAVTLWTGLRKTALERK